MITISELRRDPITNRWVVIAAERGKRPQALPEKKEGLLGVEQQCPFCPGSEDVTTSPDLNGALISTSTQFRLNKLLNS
ncbi:MAG: hypothetical protein ACOX5W_04325 [Bacillota bacterium]